MDEIYEDLDPVRLNFSVKNVENGEYVVRMFYINRRERQYPGSLERYGLYG